jgi:hypothetical protein
VASETYLKCGCSITREMLGECYNYEIVICSEHQTEALSAMLLIIWKKILKEDKDEVEE